MWLVKTEPGDYSWADLAREGRTVWDGVANPAAVRNLRAMRAGEGVIVYHTGAEKAAVGVARVARAAAAGPAAPRVELEAVKQLPRPVTLAELKSSPLFAQSPLVRQGRLSVVSLTPAQWRALETGHGLGGGR